MREMWCEVIWTPFLKMTAAGGFRGLGLLPVSFLLPCTVTLQPLQWEHRQHSPEPDSRQRTGLTDCSLARFLSKLASLQPLLPFDSVGHRAQGKRCDSCKIVVRSWCKSGASSRANQAMWK